MPFQFHWDDRQVLSDVRKNSTPILVDIGNDIAGLIKTKIDTPAPPHSVPGEYPHRLTGEMQSKTRAEAVGPGEAVIFSDAAHAPKIEQIRPFIRRVMAEQQRAIARLARRRGLVLLKIDVNP
jgi:hypothetical protein